MSDIILNNVVSSTNPMKQGDICYLCIICDEGSIKDMATLHEYFAPGRIVASDPDKELPVYPDLNCIVRDTIEATFNPDIDKTMHFDLGDVDSLHIFKVKLLVDANSTFSALVYTANACIIGEKLDMAPIRTEIKLKAIKYGKEFDTDKLSASQKQKYEESGISKIIEATKAMNPGTDIISTLDSVTKTLDGVKKYTNPDNPEDENDNKE